MAKFIKTYEDGDIKNTLTFRGKEFNLTMEYGECESKEKCFSDQLLKAFSDDEEFSEVLRDEELDVDMLDCGDEDEIQEILEDLSNWE